jgi:hypothetical protein
VNTLASSIFLSACPLSLLPGADLKLLHICGYDVCVRRVLDVVCFLTSELPKRYVVTARYLGARSMVQVSLVSFEPYACAISLEGILITAFVCLYVPLCLEVCYAAGAHQSVSEFDSIIASSHAGK